MKGSEKRAKRQCLVCGKPLTYDGIGKRKRSLCLPHSTSVSRIMNSSKATLEQAIEQAKNEASNEMKT